MQKQCVVALLVALAAVGPGLAATSDGENEAPLVDAGLDQTVSLGETVLLDGGGSRDPDGAVDAYEWAIQAPNGSPVAPACRTCERTTFVPASAGTYAVTLTVTDDDGATGSDTLFVTVEDGDGPSVSLSGPTDPAVDDGVRYRAAVDAGAAPLETLVWRVDDTVVRREALEGRHARPSLRWRFDAATTHEVSVTAVDAEGRTATDALAVGVDGSGDAAPADTGPPGGRADNQPPTVSIEGPDRAEEGGTGEFTAVASDPDGVVVDYRWSNVDGSFGNVSWRSFDAGDGAVVSISVTVEDDDGATATASREVRIGGNTAPTVTLDAPASVEACGPTTVELDASAADDDGSVQRYSWTGVDGSDGASASVTLDAQDGNGSRTVSVSVVDDDGASARSETTIDYTCSVNRLDGEASITSLEGTYTEGFIFTSESDVFDGLVEFSGDEEVEFTATLRNSFSDPLFVEWQFGDGHSTWSKVTRTGEVELTRTHTYSKSAQPGEDIETYPVSLTVYTDRDVVAAESDAKIIDAKMADAGSWADEGSTSVTADKSTVEEGEDVTFTIDGGPTSYYHTLVLDLGSAGDRRTAPAQAEWTQTKTFEDPGSYLITLLVKKNDWFQTKTKEIETIRIVVEESSDSSGGNPSSLPSPDPPLDSPGPTIPTTPQDPISTPGLPTFRDGPAVGSGPTDGSPSTAPESGPAIGDQPSQPPGGSSPGAPTSGRPTVQVGDPAPGQPV